MAAGDELVEWVAEDGTVIELVTRRRMREEVLRHRSVFVIVRNTSVKRADVGTSARRLVPSIVVHKRAGWKDFAPGAWDLAFGGVCDPGETWAQAAVRELAEEAGVLVAESELEDLGPVALDQPNVVQLLGRVFAVRYDGPFDPNDGEVTELRWLPLAEVHRFVEDEVVPEDSAALLVPLLTSLAD